METLHPELPLLRDTQKKCARTTLSIEPYCFISDTHRASRRNIYAYFATHFYMFLYFLLFILRILNFYIIAQMPGRAVFQKYIDQQKQTQNYRHKISTNLKTNSKIQMTLRRAVTISSPTAPSLFGAVLSIGL